MPPKSVPAEVFIWLQSLLSSLPTPAAPAATRGRRATSSGSQPVTEPGVTAGPDTVLGYGVKHPNSTYADIEKEDPQYLEWTLQHLRPSSSAGMHAFAEWVSTKYRLGPTNKLERKSHSTAKSLPAPTKSKQNKVPTPSYEDQMDAAMACLLDADPEAVSSLARRLVEQCPVYQETGQPAPRTMLGVRALEGIYHGMLLTEEDFEEDSEG